MLTDCLLVVLASLGSTLLAEGKRFTHSGKKFLMALRHLVAPCLQNGKLSILEVPGRAANSKKYWHPLILASLTFRIQFRGKKKNQATYRTRRAKAKELENTKRTSKISTKS